MSTDPNPNPYAAPAIVSDAPDALPLEDWELAFEKCRHRWAVLRQLGRGAVMWGPAMMLMAFAFATARPHVAAIDPLHLAILFLLGLSFSVEGIGIVLLQTWGRWLGVANALALLIWQGFIMVHVVSVRRVFVSVDLIPLICVAAALEMLYKLLTPPAADIFSPSFPDLLRRAKASGKPLLPKPRTNYRALLVLFLILAGIFLVISFL